MLSNGNEMVMPVSPMYGSGGFSNGFGGDSWGWIVLLLLLAGNGGWGFGGGMGGNLGYDFPWLLTGQNGINSNTNEGFRDAMLNDGITSIRDGIGSLSTQLCGGFGDIQQALCNGFAGVEQGANTRQIANMQTAFGLQNSINQGFNSLGSQFSDCCCENRLGLANLNSTILSENCADRAAISDGIRDLLTNQTANTQRILDQLCQDKIDAKNEKISDLERQLTMANLAASQTAQTSRILADNAAQTVALEQYLNPVPVPAYVVQNPNCCSNNGCGCGSF